MGKVLQELFWAHFLGCPYNSNGTKTNISGCATVSTGQKKLMLSR